MPVLSGVLSYSILLVIAFPKWSHDWGILAAEKVVDGFHRYDTFASVWPYKFIAARYEEELNIEDFICHSGCDYLSNVSLVPFPVCCSY